MKEAIAKSFIHHKPLWWFGACVSAALIFVAWMLTRRDDSGFSANVAFLVFGALIAMITVLVSDTIKRPFQLRDLARALYVELADRVARCCFDCEAPWDRFLDRAKCVPGQMDSFRLRKFSPIEPIVYSSTAGQLATLNGDAPQALIQFYYRLAAWRRDIDNIAAESQGKTEGIAPDNVCLLAHRVHQTLPAGLRAIEALAPMVEKPEEIEAEAIAGYDIFRGNAPSDESLRKRIRKLLPPPA